MKKNKKGFLFMKHRVHTQHGRFGSVTDSSKILNVVFFCVDC